MYPLVILAGGLATRLHPLTQKIPKALLDINGEPFIAHQLRLLASQGIVDIVICAGYLGNMLSDFTGNGASFGLNIRYSFDGDQLLGTGGAIRKCLPLLGTRFFVIYGDSYLPCNFSEVQNCFINGRGNSLMTVYCNQNLLDISNVCFSNGKILSYDKKKHSIEMQYIDYGLGVFEKSAFEGYHPNTPFDLAQVYQDQLKLGQLTGCEIHERFYEIGSLAGLEELRNFLATQTKIQKQD